MHKTIKYLLILLLLSAFTGCTKLCNKSLRIGEIVQIPIQFNGFTLSEINNIVVYRVDNLNPSLIDSFFINRILWGNEAKSINETITDKGPTNLGYYKSYFNKCNLIFKWGNTKDSFLNIEILKSKDDIKGCHKNDPNVRINKLVFTHNRKLISKGQKVNFTK